MLTASQLFSCVAFTPIYIIVTQHSNVREKMYSTEGVMNSYIYTKLSNISFGIYNSTLHIVILKGVDTV